VSSILKNTVICSGALALATSFLVGLAANNLPYSRTRDRITDTLATPGAVLVGAIYPQGAHTGAGAPFWGVAVLMSNFGVYFLFWSACLKLRSFFLKRRHVDDATDPPARRGVP
jgi:hypothetical protein